MILVEALVATNKMRLENRKRKTGVAAKLYLVECETSDGGNGIVVYEVHMGQTFIPVYLSFVHDHGQHLSRGVIDALSSSVTARVERARVNLSNAY